MLPDRVSNLGPLTYESGALPIALRSPAQNAIRTGCFKTRRTVCYYFHLLLWLYKQKDIEDIYFF